MLGETRLTGPNGEDLILLFDHAARLAVEDAGDDGMTQLVNGAFSRGRLGHLGCLVYGGLRRHHPALTLADAHGIVARAIENDQLTALQMGVMKALEASMPKKDEGANPLKAASGIGTHSSPPGAKKVSTRKASGGKPRAASR